MFLIRALIVLGVSLILVSCENDHPDISGQTKFSYQFNGSEYIGDLDQDFTRVVDFEDSREVFMYSIDTTGRNRVDMKLTIPINELGSYNFSGSLENTPAYIFLSLPDSNFELMEFYAPYNNSLLGTVTVTTNNNQHIKGNFTVQLRDAENVEPDIIITNGSFDIRY